MKTAMQKMIEYLLSETEMMPKTRMILVAKADLLLELEKKQLIDAANRERLTWYGDNLGESYYKNTFNEQL